MKKYFALASGLLTGFFLSACVPSSTSLLDTSPPALMEVTRVLSLSTNHAPSYVFRSSEAGTITYGGGCTSATTNAIKGLNTITLATLANGTYKTCTVVVTDASANASSPLTLSTFTIVNSIVAPVLAVVTPVTASSNDNTPNFTFSTTSPGTLTVGGACSSATTYVDPTNNTITFNALALGTYSNCTVRVTDPYANQSNLLAVASFTIVGPVVSLVTAVTTPTNDKTPNFTFSTTIAGTITYGGSCSSATTSAVAGSNTITFNTLPFATYSNCTVKVTDAYGNISNVLAVPAFVVTGPVLSVVSPFNSSTIDNTPEFTFNTAYFGGALTYAGSCTAATTTASVGNTTVTFSQLALGTYSNCSVRVTDAAGNVSVLAVPAFTVVSPKPINDTGVTLCGDYATKILTLGSLTASPNLPGSGYVVGTYTAVPLTNLTGTGSGAQGTMVVAAASGVITALGAITAGSGYTNGTYNNVALTGGAGTLARANITVATNKVTAVTLVFGGSGYAAANSLSAAAANIGGTGSGFAIPVSTVATQNRVSSITVTAAGANYAVSSNLSAAAASLGGSGSGLTVAIATLSTSKNDIVCATQSVTKTASGVDGTADNDPIPRAQDALYGRDSSGTTNSATDGAAGFSYTKLGANGTALAIQNGTYTAADAGTEGAGTKWSCVKDNVTNLVWEIKSDSAVVDFRDKDHKYPWYKSTSGNTGDAALPSGSTAGGTCSGASPAPSGCDTEKYVADVNTATLCGASDWRLPTTAELSTLRAVYRTSPAIETTFFPNTPTTGNYWSSSPDAAAAANAWAFAMDRGSYSVVTKATANYVRLVRGGY